MTEDAETELELHARCFPRLRREWAKDVDWVWSVSDRADCLTEVSGGALAFEWCLANLLVQVAVASMRQEKEFLESVGVRGLRELVLTSYLDADRDLEEFESGFLECMVLGLARHLGQTFPNLRTEIASAVIG